MVRVEEVDPATCRCAEVGQFGRQIGDGKGDSDLAATGGTQDSGRQGDEYHADTSAHDSRRQYHHRLAPDPLRPSGEPPTCGPSTEDSHCTHRGARIRNKARDRRPRRRIRARSGRVKSRRGSRRSAFSR